MAKGLVRFILKSNETSGFVIESQCVKGKAGVLFRKRTLPNKERAIINKSQMLTCVKSMTPARDDSRGWDNGTALAPERYVLCQGRGVQGRSQDGC